VTDGPAPANEHYARPFVGYAVGVDVGTTFTAAATARNGQVEIVGLGNHSATIPTVVFLREDGELLVGDVAARRAHAEPGRAAREFKRRFGDSTPILLGHTPYSAERLTAAVLRHVITHVTERQGGPPDALAVVHRIRDRTAGAARGRGPARRSGWSQPATASPAARETTTS